MLELFAPAILLMKIITIVFLSLFISFFSKAQTVQATYTVTEDIYAPLASGEKKVGTLTNTGYLYKKDGRYVYFEKPNYLKDYPDGYIKIQTGASNSHLVGISIDTLQYLSFVNIDSLYKYNRSNSSGFGRVKENTKQNFSLDFYEWEMLNETKTINGLKCQKASLTIRGNLQWVVWFTAEVSMLSGPFGIIGLPGLVVEAELVPFKKNYRLNTFTIGKDFPEEIFHPKEYLQPFVQLKDLKKNNDPLKQSKIQKQAELTNQ